MQEVKIPQKVDPARSAAKRLDYDGIIIPGAFTRLSGLVEEILKDVEIHLSFYVDLQGLTVFEGRAGTAVKCICQRCGESFELNLETSFKYTTDLKKVEALGITVDYDEAEPDEFGEIDIFSIVEDELILALPFAPMHSGDDCSMSGDSWVFGEVEEEPKANPFAVLNQLKSRK